MAKQLPRKEKSAKFAEGGDTHMFGSGDRTKSAPQEAAGTQSAGSTAHKPSGDSGSKFASGGGAKMFGYSPSVPARSGITSAR